MVSKNLYKINYRDGKVFYRGSELSNYAVNIDGQSNHYSPERIFILHKFYEEKLKKEKYGLLRKLEKNRNLPRTWLNSSIAGLLRGSLNGKNKGLAKRLIEEFEDRGFSEEWLKQGQDI